MLENGFWNCVGTESLSVILTGIAVVFAMLLVLILTIKLISTVVGLFMGDPKAKAEKKAAKAAAKAEAAAKKAEVAAAKAAPAPAPVAAAPAADNGGVIAAISAAVYMMLGHGNFKITGVRKAQKERKTAANAWRMAGMQDNTRPF